MVLTVHVHWGEVVKAVGGDSGGGCVEEVREGERRGRGDSYTRHVREWRWKESS